MTSDDWWELAMYAIPFLSFAGGGKLLCWAICKLMGWM